MTEQPRTPSNTQQFYRKLPISLSTIQLPPETPRWRIELAGLGPNAVALGLDILGDTVLGRGKSGTQPIDLDMNEFGGLDMGVSRRHALLRPTTEHLYLIDLGSTNGTQCNGMSLGPGVTRSIQHDDVITLGRLSFTVKVIEDPMSKDPATGRFTDFDTDAPMTPRSPLPSHLGR